MFKPNLTTDELVRGALLTFDAIKDDWRYAEMFAGADDRLRRWFDLRENSINGGITVAGELVGLVTFRRPTRNEVELHLIAHRKGRGRWSTRGFWRDCCRYGFRFGQRMSSMVLEENAEERRLLEFAGFRYVDSVWHEVGGRRIVLAIYVMNAGEQRWQ